MPTALDASGVALVGAAIGASNCSGRRKSGEDEEQEGEDGGDTSEHVY